MDVLSIKSVISATQILDNFHRDISLETEQKSYLDTGGRSNSMNPTDYRRKIQKP